PRLRGAALGLVIDGDRDALDPVVVGVGAATALDHRADRVAHVLDARDEVVIVHPERGVPGQLEAAARLGRDHAADRLADDGVEGVLLRPQRSLRGRVLLLVLADPLVVAREGERAAAAVLVALARASVGALAR